MPIQLDKILADIAEEKPLHPYNEASKNKKDQDDAWIRVGKKNKLSAHETKSIFKVLQKKYEQEKLKPSRTWKLYQQMEEICQKEEEIKPKTEPEEPAANDDESFVEFLEVREDDEDYEGDSDNQDKSMKSNSSTGSPEKDSTTVSGVDAKTEHKLLNTQMMIPQTTTPVKPDYSSVSQQPKHMTAAFTSALQKKGISMRKTSSPALKPPTVSSSQQAKATAQLRGDNPRSMLLSESMKRKLQSVEKREEVVPPAKKSFTNSNNANNSTQPASTTTQIPPVEIKQEVLDDVETTLTATSTGEAINVITIPSNPPTVSTDLSNGITTIKTNGFNTRIEDLDFQKDIIFDNTPKPSTAAGEIINIGNFENQLPPTFFKNLCNSQRHEALGLYVANVMNRVTGRAAAKLELNILKSIIEAQSDELERL